MVTIKNGQPIPEKLYDEHGNLDWQVSDFYHGKSATLVPRIMGQGLLPTIGVGSQHLEEQYGLPVPGVYVAKDWSVGSQYPIQPSTTEPIPQNKNGVNGGSLIALDGTPPMRVIIRCLGNTSRQLWHKSKNQVLFMPENLYISHISFYAVHPRLIHKYHKSLDLYSFAVDEGNPVPTEDIATFFTSTSSTIRSKVARATAPQGTGDVSLKKPVP